MVTIPRRAADHNGLINHNGRRLADVSELADDDLLRLTDGGDEGAFAALYIRYAGLLRSLALRIVRDPAVAEEVCQEAFLRAWERRSSYQADRGAVAAWLSRIARNLALDEYRRGRHERGVFTWKPGELPRPEVEDIGPGPDDTAAGYALSEHIAAAMATLPPYQSQALTLAFLRGLTHEEIANAQGYPLGTVKSRIKYGLRALRGDPGLRAWHTS
ncbi:MAG: hypothetical protein QOF01_1646 [Thermomicrobiales bacterium]|jgi:RNA polymerase sigma-70 factor (ECF subfamily)|nr:hypothetical protein [Thermomicrobiales bacterium]